MNLGHAGSSGGDNLFPYCSLYIKGNKLTRRVGETDVNVKLDKAEKKVMDYLLPTATHWVAQDEIAKETKLSTQKIAEVIPGLSEKLMNTFQADGISMISSSGLYCLGRPHPHAEIIGENRDEAPARNLRPSRR